MEKYFLTTPIYYVNAKPHVGHMYTAIAADVLARHYRAQGKKVLLSTGVDENSQKNVEAAQKEGVSPQEYVDRMAPVWKQSFDTIKLSYDTFIRTTSPEHKVAVQEMISAMEKTGDIYLGDYEGYYCVGCEEFYPQKDLVDGKCPIHKTEPKIIKEKNYFFKLSSYKEKLLAWYEEHPDAVQPASARNKMLSYITDELHDVSISRQSQEWGIRFPQDDKHAVYVWFDALINYLTVSGYPNKGYEAWWPADLHLIGKDIIKFHCAIWPAMLLSAGLPLPKKVFAHGFFTINGEKISKSLGNAIDPNDLLKEYPLDAIRYYLLREIPFGNDGDFSETRLKERYNSELANGIGNLVSRTLAMIEKYWPDFSVEKISTHSAASRQIVNGGTYQEDEGINSVSLAFLDKNISELRFDMALKIVWELVALGDKLIDVEKPWELAKEGKGEEKKVLGQLFECLVLIQRSLEALLPDTSATMKDLLTASPLKKPEQPLFARKD